MLSESPSALAGGGGSSRAAFLRATVGGAAVLAAVVAKPKEAPAFGEKGVCGVWLPPPLDGGCRCNAPRHEQARSVTANECVPTSPIT